MMQKPNRMEELTRGLTTKSAKMRALAKAGYARSEIARFLGTRYQFVRNVLVQDEARQGHSAGGTTPHTTAAGNPAAGNNASTRVRLGPEGRVVIPAAFRESLGLKEGDVLFARLEDGEIVLLTPEAAMRRAQAIVRQFVPEGVSLVDELIEERRREAKREVEGG
jgi:AbrB family looped-hinge helix DNA binding protein